MDPRITDDRIPLVRNDTGPQIRLELTDATTGQPVNLSGASAVLHFRSTSNSTLLLTRPLIIPGPTAVDGIALIVWEDGDLDHPAGIYEGEVEVVFQDSMRQTVFDPLKFRIREDFG